MHPTSASTPPQPTPQCGSDFMLPLCNAQSLALLGIEVAEVAELCAACTAFVRHVLDRTSDLGCEGLAHLGA